MPQKSNKAVEIVNEHRARVVEKVLADMRRDGLHWSEPYLPSLSPHNPVSGTAYSGGNRVHLGFVGYMRGYEDSRWCTFNQIRDSDWNLKKGSKAAIIERWKSYSVREENEETGKEEVTGSFLRCVGYWNVFNADQIEGIPPEVHEEHSHDRTAQIANDLIKSSRCPVRESKEHLGQAMYVPSQDVILMAPRETFRSDESFTRVLMHEMTHSTGHPSALARAACTKFGSPEYAEEELVAELGSLFLSSDLGIQSVELEGEHYENHVAYLKSWMSALEDDPSYLFKAASKADRADSFITERYDKVVERGRERQHDDRSADRVTLAGESKTARSAATVLGGRAGEQARVAAAR